MTVHSYNGNPNLKPVGYEHEFTAEQVQEILKCKADALYFIENYCHIVTLDHGLKLFKLYECQKQKVRTILDNRRVVCMEPRQQGKCLKSETLINIRRKSDNQSFTVKIGDFYEWQRFCKLAQSNEPDKVRAVVRILQARAAATEEKGGV